MNRIINHLKYKWYTLTIRIKLVAVFMFTCLIICIVNIFMYVNINTMIGKINEVYISNVNLNELSDSLASIQRSMTDYLGTKGSEALREYYSSEQSYGKLLENLNTMITDSHMLLMEKNIKNMSEAYLVLTRETMQAKRARNVEKYKKNYDEASDLFTYINTYINSLNNEQFKDNSDNYKVLLISMGYLKIISTTILITAIILSIFLVYILTHSITRPLIQLAKTANEIGKGNFKINLVEVRSLDEIGVVSKAFNQMILSIEQYIDKIKINLETENMMKEKELIMASHLKDAQLKYLQAQINPHFLFNTLNAGAQLAMMEEADKTCLFIENMADFFRYNIKKINEDSTLEEEIRLVDNYIYILNVRFSGEIHFEKAVEESLLKVCVPSMILQPIVENAVNYGIRDVEWTGVIKLRVYQKDDYIYISIQDNGVGIKQSKIDEIMRGEIIEPDLSKNSNGIGLGNVIKRLKLYYNCEHVIEIKSHGKNQGTEVLICIPKMMQRG
ncbi:sensor histidine kinase [Cellulosilyticum sp. I15G10I2]|uniref:sensor histidine kinase n=1 Tax=Cellulosilyticum sp. I15G10I2 TaxID=1892843 RepID=UPI00085C326F|nr:histidine kinase [Cellulosilyticum sp. I15G10I2]